ncbi:MAG TPA: PLD nuclease N-terminal domain-containing protein [Verrucomicrobiota bacterium]|nr:PLD nuclease N-terminal domain-containing protein [Verrucomicrobiota bacterium]HNU51066.1 PLD nuclease N-terminal domain-containing protein [Verrucomicrobiota bacterium]
MGLDLIVLPIFFLGVLLAIAGTVFWIWMLVDCALHEPSEGNDKLVWIVIILFTHILGALIYFFARRPRRLRTGGNG